MPDHIIVLEDDEVLRYSYCKILDNAGYVPRPFPDFRNVLETLVPGSRTDLLLTDIILGRETPHGLAVAEMARTRRPLLPVVFLTGHREYARFVPSYAKVLFKPVEAEALLAAVETSLTTARGPFAGAEAVARGLRGAGIGV